LSEALAGVRQAAAQLSLPTRAALAYTLGALFVLNTMNYVDRQLFGVMQELIKRDVGLSDFQLGLVGGPAFAVLYILAAFPIARLAERWNRVSIVSLAFGTWSVMTAICGGATSFLQLLLARGAVSIGEAGCAPASHALIADYFPPQRRTSAMSIFGAAGPIGALSAAIGGGLLAQRYGWRTTFFACGALGLAAAVLFRLTVREPRQGGSKTTVGLRAALRLLCAKRSFLAVAAASACAGFASYSNSQYMVSFLMRVHGLPVAAAATAVGLILGAVGIVMTLSTGVLIEHGRRRFPRIRTWLPAGGLIWAGCIFALAYLARPTPLAIGLLAAGSLGQHFYMPAMYTLAQDVAPASMRATSAALMISVVSLVGYGIGPPLIGLLSDMLGTAAMHSAGLDPRSCLPNSLGECAFARAHGLGLSMSAGSIFFIVGGVLFGMSGRSIVRDMVR
jgi:MFS family permease